MQTCMWARVVGVCYQYDCCSPKRKRHLPRPRVSPNFFHHSICSLSMCVVVPKFDYSTLFQQLHQLRRVIFGRADLGCFAEPWQHSFKILHYFILSLMQHSVCESCFSFNYYSAVSFSRHRGHLAHVYHIKTDVMSITACGCRRGFPALNLDQRGGLPHR